MLILYNSSANKAPILIDLSSSEGQFLDLFKQHDFKTEWKNRGDAFVQSIDMMSIENKLYIYASWLDRRLKQLFCIDRENESVNEISDTCGIPCEYLLTIKSIAFKNPSTQKLVGMHYRHGLDRIKLFSFSGGIFTDVSDELTIQNFDINNPDFIKIIQDDFGTMLIVKSSTYQPWILYDSDETNHYEYASRIKRAPTSEKLE